MKRNFSTYLNLLVLSLSFTLLTNIKPSQSQEQYVGLDHIPSHLKFTQGWLIQNSQYGLSEIIDANCVDRFTCNSSIEPMIWLKKYLGNKPDGKPIYQVVDVMEIPTSLNTSKEMQLLSFCQRNNQPTPEIFAWGLFEYDQDYFTKIDKAWQANVNTGQLEEISTDNIKCINPAGANYDG